MMNVSNNSNDYSTEEFNVATKELTPKEKIDGLTLEQRGLYNSVSAGFRWSKRFDSDPNMQKLLDLNLVFQDIEGFYYPDNR